MHKVAQLLQLKGMLEVEAKIRRRCRRKLFALDLAICTSLKIRMVQKDEVAQFQARCNELRHLLEPTQVSRDEGYRSQELESMQMG